LAELDSLLAALDRGVETETETEPDYGDYSSRARELDYDYSSKWDYLGQGIWGAQDYSSQCSTLRTEFDSGALSEEELERETGAGPRGEESRIIETEGGTVQSKYRYMGFGLWENLDPTKPKKPKKRPPPPPPPKAEPIMYNCTVAVSGTINSKELDDLNTTSWFSQLECRRDWVAGGGADLLAGQPEPYQEFEKADMSDMFSRAMLEKMQLVDDPPAQYSCYVCSLLIQGRIITAMGNKFHPACFVCTYCRKPFKDRKYKTDPRENTPYCPACFEKLLGHFGNAHG